MTPSVTNIPPLWTARWARANSLDFRYFPITDSSHLQAKKVAFEFTETSFQLFIAEKQTAGRGQNEKIWLNSDLMATWLWRKTKSLTQAPLLSVSDLASDLLNAMLSCWPDLPGTVKKTNDIFLKDKKCAGLLLEIIEQGHSQATLIGIGMNVFSHPEGVNAGHLCEHLKNLSEKEWHVFLSRLNSAWNQRIQDFPIPS